MHTELLKTKFNRIGARAKVRPMVRNRWQQPAGPIVIDIGLDRRGEFFDLQAEGDADISILDVKPKDRHLLLMVRQPARQSSQPEIKDKFLCGHDERHWFVAGIPEAAPVSSVVTAKEALKPELVRNLEQGQKRKRKNRHRRRTDVYVRQGEWFFVPVSDASFPDHLVLANEPIQRGGRSKPHLCQFLHRNGGTSVLVCHRHPNGLTIEQYLDLKHRDPLAAKWNWRLMRRDPSVFVRGRVSHADHATIRLPCWHRVAMNTENQSRAMASVAFLD